MHRLLTRGALQTLLIVAILWASFEGASDSASNWHPHQRSLAYVTWPMTASSQVSTTNLDTFCDCFFHQSKVILLSSQISAQLITSCKNIIALWYGFLKRILHKNTGATFQTIRNYFKHYLKSRSPFYILFTFSLIVVSLFLLSFTYLRT